MGRRRLLCCKGGNLAGVVVDTAASAWLARLRSQPSLNPQRLRELVLFGGGLTINRIVNYFALQGDKPIIEYAFGIQNWFEAHACEHMAAREKVAIFDQTSFSKFMLEGPDALPLLQRLCGADMDLEIGRITYTGMFNQRGTFESDLSIVRTAEDTYYLITATSQTIHDQDWIRRNVRDGERISLRDVTKDLSVVSVMGPNSRELLQRVTDADLDDFPFGSTLSEGVGICLNPDKYWPVMLFLHFITNLGVPETTISPPFFP